MEKVVNKFGEFEKCEPLKPHKFKEIARAENYETITIVKMCSCGYMDYVEVERED